MDMSSAAVFLGGSILYAVGLLVILIAIVVANNIIHKYWKSFGWKFFPTWISDSDTVRFATEEEVAKTTKK